MKEHVCIDEIKTEILKYTGRSEAHMNGDFETLWYGFRKYCKRNKCLSRQTLATIRRRKWMSVVQAQKFYDYAGI